MYMGEKAHLKVDEPLLIQPNACCIPRFAFCFPTSQLGWHSKIMVGGEWHIPTPCHHGDSDWIDLG